MCLCVMCSRESLLTKGIRPVQRSFLLHPFVSQGFLGVGTSINVLLTQKSHEVFRFSADIVPLGRRKIQLRISDDGEQLLFVVRFTVERRESADHDIKNDADRPHVDLGVIWSARQFPGNLYHLGG